MEKEIIEAKMIKKIMKESKRFLKQFNKELSMSFVFRNQVDYILKRDGMFDPYMYKMYDKVLSYESLKGDKIKIQISFEKTVQEEIRCVIRSNSSYDTLTPENLKKYEYQDVAYYFIKLITLEIFDIGLENYKYEGKYGIDNFFDIIYES